MKPILSHYRPRYIRALVYMLQSCEYEPTHYWKWYRRTHDFSQLEQRSHLDKTIKARVLIAVGWILAVSYWLSLSLLIYHQNRMILITAIIIGFILTPYLLAILIVIPVWALGLGQKYYERRVIAQTITYLQKHPATKIAIAGSFGKTSMRQILYTILNEGQRTAAAEHNYNTPLGIGRFVSSLTGLEEVLIFELGEYYPGDVKRLASMTLPDLGIITGVNEAHLERFGSIERTTATIFELADYLGTKPVYVNADNDLSGQTASRTHIAYSTAGCGSVTINHVKVAADGTSFSVKLLGNHYAAHTKLLGTHNLGPIAAAATIALELGLTPAQVITGIAKTTPFEHRLEPSRRGDVTYIDDSYNGNPDGVKAAIELLKTMPAHEHFYVTPGLVEMGTSSDAVHRQIGAWLAAANIEQVILIRSSVTEMIAKGLAEHNFTGRLRWFSTGPQAFRALPNLTVADDVVLLQNDWPDQYS